MTATAKAKSTCPQCPQPGDKGEWYHFFAMVFDVKKARELAEGEEIVHVTAAQLVQYGIRGERLAPTARTFKVGLAGVNEDHLQHIPVEALDRPLLFATLPTLVVGAANHVLIDGSHTATIKVRRGDEKIAAVILSPELSRECCERGWQEMARGFSRRARQSR